jgi:hypothetical protein
VANGVLLGSVAPAAAGVVIDLSTAPLTFHGTDPGGRAGQSLAAIGGVLGVPGGFIAGAAFADPFGRDGAGAVYLESGSTDTGLRALNTVDYRVMGSQAGGAIGFAVSAGGDVNDDGIPDFVVGGWSVDAGERLDAGAAYLFLGDASLDGWDLPAGATATVVGLDAEDHLGWAVEIRGDLDDDGVADLVLGAPLGEGSGLAAGEVFIFFGSAGFPAGELDAASADVRLTSSETTSGFGHALSVGDLDDDGIDDLVVGAPGKDFSGRFNAGAAYVFRGRASWPSAIDADTGADLVILGAFGTDGFGAALDVVGDVNDDGAADLVVGAPYAVVGGNDLSGRVYVFAGGALPATLDARNDAATVLRGTARGDVAGISVSRAGDINANGIADFVVGAPGYDAGGLLDAGAAFYFAGSSVGFPASGPLPDVASRVYAGAFPGDEAGASVGGVGDYDGDGVDDLAVGAPGHDFGTQADVGAIYVLRSEVTVSVPGQTIAGFGSPRPNPFRASVWIPFSAGLVEQEVRVVDVLGRHVRELRVTGEAVHWDGRDARGRRMPPGVYLVEGRNIHGRQVRERVVLAP